MVSLRVRTPEEERRAGRAATERFRAGRSEWRQRIRRPALGVCGAMVLASFVPAAVLDQLWGFASGVFGGAFIGLYLWLRDDPPEYVARWEWGADAERATARALRGLVRSGWFVVHDVPYRLGNMDHVVIGPAGVFRLETKWLGGEASIAGDEIRVQRRLDPDSNYVTGGVGRRTRSRAVDLGAALAEQTGRRPWVTAVAVIDSKFADGVVDGDRITFVRRDLLSDWMTARPHRLAVPEVEQLAAAMRTLVERADAGDAKRRASKRATAEEPAPFILGVQPTPTEPIRR